MRYFTITADKNPLQFGKGVNPLKKRTDPMTMTFEVVEYVRVAGGRTRFHRDHGFFSLRKIQGGKTLNWKGPTDLTPAQQEEIWRATWNQFTQAENNTPYLDYKMPGRKGPSA